MEFKTLFLYYIKIIKIIKMKKLKLILSVFLLALLTSYCTYQKDGMLVKDANGTIYRLEATNRTNEGYHVVEVDTTGYNKLLK